LSNRKSFAAWKECGLSEISRYLKHDHSRLISCIPRKFDLGWCAEWRDVAFLQLKTKAPKALESPDYLTFRCFSNTFLLLLDIVFKMIYGEMYSFALLVQAAQGFPLLQNTTIPLPNGTTNHGTPGLICTPTRWTDIIVFYLANYAAHAATTRSLPGESTASFAVIVFAALLFPRAGAFRGFMGIFSLAVFGKTDLEKAARAGALCMLVRTDEWNPGLGSDIPPESRIHGYHNVPPGYTLCRVPRGATFLEPSHDQQPSRTLTLSFNYSLVKIMISLGQAIYAIFTLYGARGDQIAQFGYAAFGLTVAPYAVVSLINLLGSLLCPEFAAMYMIESSIMEEARRMGDEYKFEGAVAKLNEGPIREHSRRIPSNVPKQNRWIYNPVTVSVHEGRPCTTADNQKHHFHTKTENSTQPFRMSEYHQIEQTKRMYSWPMYASWSGVLLPIIIIGALSGFHRGHSTLAQRVWTMTWLSFGSVGTEYIRLGRIFTVFSDADHGMPAYSSWPILLWYVAPAIGGFVVVGQMLRSYGTCLSVS
jgi:hypothetical protein